MKANFKITKSDDDKKQVFGWASVAADTDGKELADCQGDIINPEDLEVTAYDYVLNYGDTGEQHNPQLRKKGKLIESVMLTKEKMQSMGIPEGILPYGWWVGFQITDNSAWEKIKEGEYNMFSIEGQGQRIPTNKAVASKARGYREFYTLN